ncbi:MAG: hypothetical protein U0795_03555 [Pirellulales bacterium]
MATTVMWASWSLWQRGDDGPQLPDLNVSAAELSPAVPEAASGQPGPYQSRLTSLQVGPEEPTMLQPSLTDVPRPPRDSSSSAPTAENVIDEVPVDLHQQALPQPALPQPALPQPALPQR